MTSERALARRALAVLHQLADPTMTKAECDQLIAAVHIQYAQTRNKHLLDVLACNYRRYAESLTYRYVRQGVDADELRAVALMALTEALIRYDPDRGTHFTAYARPYIVGMVIRWFRDEYRPIHIARSDFELLPHVARAREELGASGSRPTAADIARHLGVTEAEVARAETAHAVSFPVSMNEHLVGRFETYGDVIGNEDPAMELVDIWSELRDLLRHLDQREREVVVRWLYGDTQVDIGRVVGCSQMHVSRLLSKALASARSASDR